MNDKKYRKALIATLIVFTLIYWVNHLINQPTYGDIITDLFDGRAITEIRIYDETSGDLDPVTISDNRMINNILEKPAKTKLRKKLIFIGVESSYTLFLETDNGQHYDMNLNENLIKIDDSTYTNRGDDRIYKTIQEAYITIQN